jgi:hypothetical protein
MPFFSLLARSSMIEPIGPQMIGPMPTLERSDRPSPNASLRLRLATLGLRLQRALGDLEADFLVVGHLGHVGLLESKGRLDQGSFGANASLDFVQMIAPKVRMPMSSSAHNVKRESARFDAALRAPWVTRLSLPNASLYFVPRSSALRASGLLRRTPTHYSWRRMRAPAVFQSVLDACPQPRSYPRSRCLPPLHPRTSLITGANSGGYYMNASLPPWPVMKGSTPPTSAGSYPFLRAADGNRGASF